MRDRAWRSIKKISNSQKTEENPHRFAQNINLKGKTNTDID